MEIRRNVQQRATTVGRAGEGKSPPINANITQNVLTKQTYILKHLQAKENSINFATKNNNGCEVTSMTDKIFEVFIKIKYIFN